MQCYIIQNPLFEEGRGFHNEYIAWEKETSTL